MSRFGQLLCLWLVSVSVWAEQQAVRPPVEPVPSTAKPVTAPAFKDDDRITDISSLSGFAVYFGVLLDGQAVTDTALEDDILAQLRAAASGLKCQRLDLKDNAIHYQGHRVSVLFFTYTVKANGDVTDGRPVSVGNQSYLMGRLKANLKESLERTAWVAPDWNRLGVPAFPGVEKALAEEDPMAVTAREFTTELTTLRNTLDAIEKVDAPFVAQLRRRLDKLTVESHDRMSLEGNSAPQVIYQIVRATEDTVFVAQQSYDKLPEAARSDAMLYALLSSFFQQSDRVRARAWEFHLSLVSLVRRGEIDLKAYDEAKRNFVRSERTDTLLRLADDCNAFGKKLAASFAEGDEAGKQIVQRFETARQVIYQQAKQNWARDYAEFFTNAPRGLGPSVAERSMQIQYEVWDQVAKWLNDPKDIDDVEARARILVDAIPRILGGQITQEDIYKAVEDGAAKK